MVEKFVNICLGLGAATLSCQLIVLCTIQIILLHPILLTSNNNNNHILNPFCKYDRRDVPVGFTTFGKQIKRSPPNLTATLQFAVVEYWTQI